VTKKQPAVPQMRGVQAFLSISNDSSSVVSNLIPIDKIRFSFKQPRRYFDQAKMEQLIQSVKEHGILEPLLVRPLDGDYELVAGERRYRAAQALGLNEVPVTVRELSDKEALQVALIENLQREDLNPVEETEGILDLLALELVSSREEVISLLNRAANAKKRSQELTENVSRQLEQIEGIFAVVGRITPESFRTTRLPLLNLPIEILEVLHQGKVAYTKAHVLARIKDEVQRKALLQAAIDEDLSLSQIKERIARLNSADSEETLTNSSSLDKRIDTALRLVKQSKVWHDPKKQKQLEKLLAGLEALVSKGE